METLLEQHKIIAQIINFIYKKIMINHLISYKLILVMTN
jgi:hypothetical protein